MSLVATFPKSAAGHLFPEEVTIGWERGPQLPAIVAAGAIDAYVASAHAYFERGPDAAWLAEEIGWREESVVELARRCERESERVTLAVLPSQRRDSRLRGVVLAPSTESTAYAPFGRGFPTAAAIRGEPSRDFLYAVAWEAFTEAEESLGAKRVGLGHFTAGTGHWCVHFDGVAAAVMLEAVAHRCERCPSTALEAVTFLGHCGHIERRHVEEGVRLLRHDRRPGHHRPIETHREARGAATIVTLALAAPE